MKIYIFLFFLILETSCTFYGITNDYKKLNEINQSKIEKLQDFEVPNVGMIYEINAIQLKEELKKFPKAIVYLFTNGCTSEFCEPLEVYEEYAKENGYKLFLVMTGYGHLNKTLSQNVETQLFSIDAEFYGVKNKSKYTRFFRNQLEGFLKEHSKREFKGSLFFFQENNLVNVFRELP